MATMPYFVISPSAILSLIGLMRGPEKITPTPAEDWKQASIHAIVLAKNEQKQIAFCLDSLSKQTVKPQKITLVDDASDDHTVEFVKEISDKLGLGIEIIRNEKTMRKINIVNKIAHESNLDVIFVLDGDTALESENFIARLVEELYKGAGVAAASGMVLPLTRCSRKRFMAQDEKLSHFIDKHPDANMMPKNWFKRFNHAYADAYRDVLYRFLQGFVYKGERYLFGGIINPIGCASVYRRKFAVQQFDQFHEIIEKSQIKLEDFFFGFTFSYQGYRNAHISDVFARTQEPSLTQLPKQLYRWTTDYLHSLFRFKSLIISPLWVFRRMAKKHREKTSGIENKRQIKEAYRQAWGTDVTKTYGRPIGWYIACMTLEKFIFPAVLIFFLAMRWWEVFAITVIAESLLSSFIFALLPYKNRVWRFFKSLLTVPVRYIVLFYDVLLILLFFIKLPFESTKEDSQ